MSKPTIVYATILTVCGAGLWGILRTGSDLAAVTDVAGEWRIESGPLGPSPGGPERLGTSFVLDQSGRFFRVRFSRGQVMDLKATTAPMGRLGDRPAQFELTAGQQRLAATVWRDGKRVAGSFRLTGPEVAEFVAYRVPAGGARADAGSAASGQTAAAGPDTRPAVPTAAVDDFPQD